MHNSRPVRSLKDALIFLAFVGVCVGIYWLLLLLPDWAELTRRQPEQARFLPQLAWGSGILIHGMLLCGFICVIQFALKKK